MCVIVAGASRDRAKFGYRAVRAYAKRGHDVYAVNPGATSIEGLPCFALVMEVKGPVDRLLVYLPAAAALGVLREGAARNDVAEVWPNPGVDDPRVVQEAAVLGLKAIRGCAIIDIGESPSSY